MYLCSIEAADTTGGQSTADKVQCSIVSSLLHTCSSDDCAAAVTDIGAAVGKLSTPNMAARSDLLYEPAFFAAEVL